MIENNETDMVSFGRFYIPNPDLVERIRNGWPINTESEMGSWLGGDAKGFTDYPTY